MNQQPPLGDSERCAAAPATPDANRSAIDRAIGVLSYIRSAWRNGDAWDSEDDRVVDEAIRSAGSHASVMESSLLLAHSQINALVRANETLECELQAVKDELLVATRSASRLDAMIPQLREDSERLAWLRHQPGCEAYSRDGWRETIDNARREEGNHD